MTHATCQPIPANLLLCITLLTALLGSAQALGQNEPTSPGDAALAAFVEDRLAQLDRGITAMSQSLDELDRTDRFVREAGIAMRQLTRSMWLTVDRALDGEADAEAGGIAAVAALTLEPTIAPFDDAVAALPERVQQTIRQHGADSEPFKRLSSGVDAVKSFQAAVGDAPTRPPQSDAAVTRRLSSTMKPLARLAAVTGHRRGVTGTGWPSTSEIDAARGPSEPSTLESLRQQTGNLTLGDDTAERMAWLLDMLERAERQPALRPRAAGMRLKLGRLLDARRIINSTDWLAADTKRRLATRFDAAIADLARPARATGDDRAALHDIAALLARLDAMKQLDPGPRDQLRRALQQAALHAATSKPDTIQPAHALTASARIEALDALMRTMQQHRAIEYRELSTVLDRARDAFAAEYDKLETSLLAVVAAADADTALGPALQQRLDRLSQLHHQVRRLNDVPAWSETIGKLNRHAPGGFERQAQLIAEDLLSPRTHAAAAAVLADFEARLTWIATMPNERLIAAPLEAPDSADRWPTRRQAEALRHQLTVLRSQWAAAWSAGVDPGEATDRLELMRRLMVAGGRANTLASDPPDASALNRWPGWQAPPQAIAAIAERIPSALDSATAAAAAGQWDQLDERLTEAERWIAAPWLAHQLTTDLKPLLAVASDAWPTAMARLRFAPRADAYLAGQRADLGWLCLTLAAGNAQPADSTGITRADLLARIAAFAQAVLDARAGATDDDRKSRPAPISAIDL